jgi:LPS export ABC transporter protein LptC
MNIYRYDNLLSLCFFCAFSVVSASCTANTAPQGARNAGNPPPKIKIVAPVYTEIKQDAVVYSGTALSAEYFDRTHPGIITKPTMNGTLTNGETFSVSSDLGHYDESRHVITLNDNIHALLDNTYMLTCSGIDYFIEKKLMISEDTITVNSKDLQLQGDKGSIDLKTNIMTIKGNINAKIYNMSLK